MTSFPNNNGSIWRKWDLQVQTRLDQGYTCLGQSLLPDQLAKLQAVTGLSSAQITAQERSLAPADYAKLLVSYVVEFTDLDVIGITDHNTGKELDAIIEAAQNTRLTVLPGVEVASCHGIHILCLFDPEQAWKENWNASIDNFMTEIGLTGSAFNEHAQPSNGTKSSQEILELVANKGGVSIFAHIATENGLFYRQSSTANGGTAHKDIYIHRQCQIVQLPHSGNVDVGTQNIIDGKDANYENKRVAKIKCSDARKLSDIGSQFTWIKADPTLEGLKQIIYESDEPDERVRVQSHNPFEDRKKVFLQQVSVTGSKNFVIPNGVNIPLNRELVTIIGGRGTGKVHC